MGLIGKRDTTEPSRTNFDDSNKHQRCTLQAHSMINHTTAVRGGRPNGKGRLSSSSSGGSGGPGEGGGVIGIGVFGISSS